jgi:RHO1 GDP-GTP exchange protein 1/2
VVTAADDGQNASNSGTLRSRAKGQALVRRNSFGKEKGGVNLAAVRGEAKGQFWINFIHLGRRPYQLLLWASTPVAHRKWIDVIAKQQQIIIEKGTVFDTIPLSEGFFSGPNKVNCAAPYSKCLVAFVEMMAVTKRLC